MSKQRFIPAGEFKAQCLKLMDELREEGGEIVITKRGTAVAKLVPATQETRDRTGDDDSESIVGCMEGSVTIHGDIVGPLHEEWRLRDDE